jgi:hypothetical protein
MENKIKPCKLCKKDFPEESFYKIGKDPKGNVRRTMYCKKCHATFILKRQRNMKQKCINLLGGKCSRCGYNKFIGALEFHHKDPSTKEMTLSSHRLHSFKKCEEELKKCILLCANCHREIHNEMHEEKKLNQL